MCTGFSIIPIFVFFIISYYSALFKFIEIVKFEYALIWHDYASKFMIVKSSDTQIGYQILRAIAVKQINVEGETKVFATIAWRRQNIGGAIFLIAILCLLIGKTLMQLH